MLSCTRSKRKRNPKIPGDRGVAQDGRTGYDRHMVAFRFKGDRLVADSSSLIYLAKSSLIRPFVGAFDVVVPALVFRECVRSGYPGSDEIRGLRREGLLSVRGICGDLESHLRLPRGGEREAIILFYQLGPDGLLIDDREGVRFCLRRGIPFLSALLVPSLLVVREIIGAEEARKSLERIVEVGRYSGSVIFFAREVLQKVSGGVDVFAPEARIWEPPGETSQWRKPGEPSG
ncbi:MAG: hypothetical protein JRH07_00255 [Deltaproteobacteria bacterium]|nr:hypothetical protein [Deltaproteobacteria bacterium]MBW2120266.1 hypothetical protein [Deltaproteobacteria bacterium]